jgi:hypothetical protein
MVMLVPVIVMVIGKAPKYVDIGRRNEIRVVITVTIVRLSDVSRTHVSRAAGEDHHEPGSDADLSGSTTNAG